MLSSAGFRSQVKARISSALSNAADAFRSSPSSAQSSNVHTSAGNGLFDWQRDREVLGSSHMYDDTRRLLSGDDDATLPADYDDESSIIPTTDLTVSQGLSTGDKAYNLISGVSNRSWTGKSHLTGLSNKNRDNIIKLIRSEAKQIQNGTRLPGISLTDPVTTALNRQLESINELDSVITRINDLYDTRHVTRHYPSFDVPRNRLIDVMRAYMWTTSSLAESVGARRPELSNHDKIFPGINLTSRDSTVTKARGFSIPTHPIRHHYSENNNAKWNSMTSN